MLGLRRQVVRLFVASKERSERTERDLFKVLAERLDVTDERGKQGARLADRIVGTRRASERLVELPERVGKFCKCEQVRLGQATVTDKRYSLSRASFSSSGRPSSLPITPSAISGIRSSVPLPNPRTSHGSLPK